MIKNINKILLKIIIAELLILMIFVVRPIFTAKKAIAAHDVGTPTEFYITIKSISLRSDNGESTIFKGTEVVDLAKVNSFESALNINVDIKPDIYKTISIECDSVIRVKGSVIMNGVTYYTKEGHTNYTTAPAELETIDMTGANAPRTSQTFLKPVSLSGNIILRLIVDIENVLVYWDGMDQQVVSGQTTAGMTVVRLPMAVVLDKPGYKEIYQVTTDNSPGLGILALIFDSNNNFVGGMGRALMKNSNTYSIFFTGGFSITNYSGEFTNISIGAESEIAWYITGFTRTGVGGRHSGSWSNKTTGVTSGTYSAVRIQ